MSSAPVPARRRPASRRGSILIVALIFSAIIGIALTSYLRLSTSTLQVATRSYLSNSAIYLAETGVELAMNCLNNNQTNGVALATAWPSTIWTTNSSTHEATATFSGFTPAPGATGVIRVYVRNYDLSGNPTIVSRSTVTPGIGATPLSKYLEISLSRRGLFVNGLVAKDSISWVGHPLADSWTSDPDNNPATAAVAYSAASGTQKAGCTVGCVNGSITLGSGGDVYGYARTGSAGTTTGGSVHGLGTTTNDSSRISTDFSATFPAITLPAPALVNVLAAVPTTLPGGSHSMNIADNRYYYTWGSSLAGITGNITITGNVTITMTGRAGSDAIRLTGNKALTLGSTASLTLYTDGDVSAFGNGIVNTTTAEKFQIYGTGASGGSQSIIVGGNGNLIAAVYAPNAAVEMKGGGSSGNVMGSVVAKTISMNGGTNFHYDEALGNLNGGGGYRTSKWKELQSAAERAVYSIQLGP